MKVLFELSWGERDFPAGRLCQADFCMITGEIKNQIDRIWDAFWSGGISNPLEVIEQITYLLFLRRLDDLHTLEENKSVRLKRPMERVVFVFSRRMQLRLMNS
jgi:hypothetical protein